MPGRARLRRASGVLIDVGGLVVERAARGNIPNELRITRDHGDHLGRQLHVGPGAVLKSSVAPFAHGDRYLVRRAPGVPRAPQDFARYLQKERVVVHRLGAPAPNESRSFAKGCVRLRAHVEAQNVSARLGPPRVGGAISTLLAGYELLDLPDGLAARGLEPLALGGRCRDPHELTHGRPGKRALAQRRTKPGKLFESHRGPELGVGSSEVVAEQRLDVLRERRVPEMAVHIGAKSTEQCQPFAAIELGALLREPLELLVCRNPVHGFIDPNTLCHGPIIHPSFSSLATPSRHAFAARIGARAISVPKNA
nr:MAG: hypothetical protein DIU78_21075 [Pseudomonadota bacterium]